MLGINRNNMKLCFLAFSMFLAGLSISDMTTYASSGSLEEVFFKRIEEADNKGRLRTAKDDIQRVLRLNPKHMGAIYYGGKYAHEIGNDEMAERMLKKISPDSKYSEKAMSILAEMRMYEVLGKNIESVKIVVSGGAYSQALKLCEEYLEASPESKGLLLIAGCLSCALGDQDKAEVYYLKLYGLDPADADCAELRSLIDAWFMSPDRNVEAIDKLLSLTSRDLLITPVRNKLKELVKASGRVEQYESFIEKEKAVPGASINALERDLISFYISNEEYEKALVSLEQRPIDSLEDNLLYIDILTKTGREEKALENAGYLMNAFKGEDKCFKAWVTAWISYADRTKQVPGSNDPAKQEGYFKKAETVLMELDPTEFTSSDPALLFKLMRIAVVTGNEGISEDLKNLLCTVDFTPELSRAVIESTDEFITNNQSTALLDIMQKMWESLPTDYNIPMKMAEITADTNPERAAEILESVLAANPKHLKALLIWSDCMSKLERPEEAAERLGNRLKEPDIDAMSTNQIRAKLEILSFQGVDISKYDPEYAIFNEENEEGENKNVASESTSFAPGASSVIPSSMPMQDFNDKSSNYDINSADSDSFSDYEAPIQMPPKRKRRPNKPRQR